MLEIESTAAEEKGSEVSGQGSVPAPCLRSSEAAFVGVEISGISSCRSVKGAEVEEQSTQPLSEDRAVMVKSSVRI